MQEFQSISGEMRSAEELEDRATQNQREIKGFVEKFGARLSI